MRNNFNISALVAIAVLFLPAVANANDAAPPRGLGILDLLLFGFLIFLLIRFFRRRFGSGDDSGDQDTPSRRQPRGDDSEQYGEQGQTPNRHDAAKAMWDMLSSDDQPSQPAQQSHPSAARARSGDDFDPAEFIEGAKMFFSRFHEARDAGKLEQLKDFIAPELYEELQQGGESGEPARTEVMLVDARLGDRQSADGRTVVSVFFDATLRKGVSGETPYNYRGVWEFSKPMDSPDSLWTLEKMERVDH
ncbi:TIM44-like domain-containing protein [Salidesulfovibrio brasiliensis]